MGLARFDQVSGNRSGRRNANAAATANSRVLINRIWVSQKRETFSVKYVYCLLCQVCARMYIFDCLECVGGSSLSAVRCIAKIDVCVYMRDG